MNKREMLDKERIAIAIDTSGSIDPSLLKVYSCGIEAKEVYIPRQNNGTPIEPINELAKRFKRVYYFTDGYYTGEALDNVTIINIDNDEVSLMDKREIPEVSDKEKIEVLERIVTCIFDMNNFKHPIQYRKYCKDTDMIWVTIRCDPDDASKVLSNLRFHEIEYDFTISEEKLSEEDVKLWNKEYDGYCEIDLYIEPIQWKEVERLKKENEELKKLLNARLDSIEETLKHHTIGETPKSKDKLKKKLNVL